MRVYATTTDAWPTTPPANADDLLSAASRVVDALLFGVVYDTTTTGMPSDTDVAEVLKEATVAIALEAEANGTLDPGSSREWESVAIGNVALSNQPGASDSDTPNVMGLLVPAAARLALASLGRPSVVWS